MTGHCSNCGKIWTLETRQGLCQWCGKLATCQSQRTQALRSLKSRSNGRKRQAHSNGNGYDQLDGEWLTYYKVASRFSHKAQAQDREDLLHDIMIALADVARNNGDKPFTEPVMCRVASYEVTEYWHTLMRHRPTILSLNDKADNGNGSSNGDDEAGEIIDFLADDNTVDLDLKLDARRFLLGCPRRLVQIAYKRYSGIPLDSNEHKYLCKWRKTQQKALF